ncbi:UDP-N-acetylmuramoyl-tripeptide--D-alanyl-D-alanine ligase [Clostridium pasteurianum DSM 525 = ATCC 6013]|uniref:UDP-N-acetylmuramoyl-tripeptide--D-alanyl-D-alanine ligase n=1 Tax=Clostridium pasteurianum DSM 525 = ATCC 6013 TaxID=1262449 RepID=A0A0H3J1Z1_CLOPA|nr:UDP-N-acetylmuramoyl-tripeptide--D-alanyl-D-alanine ligase [Clostridium pasteurianum]AJA47926.1 UDP-N-acetylmuramoyl-tripeptide--D-alanyl-D-alanine ligase [Clostridium pasteurianum DSM 525 = ATCC 6013]AJA51914.1 UDP-N-acetylmuramoyl-tripeptide--D-alanyl-D-alanine ligase [Clostridium pasteurianum DSM 525 = ATCC 6013]AOZ75213.1 UDP-N-acetylmuramoyl-tripeptide--D-alanyl-D-alanine ligase [Clostridium pasteurianum DSM 525 = ATCC 6013]AOZ79008.1 UDP-N-acetylmuramoyl-tripeptide--D-alanyl-D-alanine 
MEYKFLSSIVEAVEGKLLIKGSKEAFNHVSIDTRKIEPGSIFIAIKGDKYNANEFVAEASKKGAGLCIVDEIKFKEEDISKDTSIIIVENTRKALLKLAEFYRSTLDIKIVGITGSTGKTTTKDMTYAILSQKYKVFKTEGNFNNEIGLPLMIFNLDKSYDIAVLEMGMSNFFEIHNMAKAAKPDIALITNIGISHIENLKTREYILQAKLEITDYFNSNSTLILNSDNDMLSKVNREDKIYKIISTSTESDCELKAENVKLKEAEVVFDISRDNKVVFEGFKVGLPGKHNISNALLAIACGEAFGLTYEEMNRGMEGLNMTSMRLDIIKGKKYTIVNDCYNASPDSMIAAIDVLKNIRGKRKIAVLGTMRELGEKAYDAHREIGTYAKKNSVDLLIVLGEFEQAYREGFQNSEKIKKFNSTEEASEFLDKFIKEDDVVLVKASRAMKFEKIVSHLEENN